MMRPFALTRARACLISLRLPCVALAGLLAGCAALAPIRPPAGTAAPHEQAATRAYHPAIDIAGRLSLRYERNGAEQAIDGKFTWHQTHDATHITLATPFGQTLATIDITPA